MVASSTQGSNVISSAQMRSKVLPRCLAPIFEELVDLEHLNQQAQDY